MSAEQLQRLPSGAVVLDMAGGNVENSIDGRLLDNQHYKLLADSHLASDVAYSASFLHSRNVYNFLSRFDKIKQDKEVWSQILLTKA